MTAFAKTLFEKMDSRFTTDGKARKLSKTTITNYAFKLNKICREILGEDLTENNIKFIKDADKVIDFIKKSDMTGKKDYLSPIVRILKEGEDNNEIVEKYQKAMSSFKIDEDKVRKTNTSTQKEKDNFISYPDAIKKIQQYNPKENALGLVYLLINALYFMNSFVPRNDLNIFKLASNKKKLKELNKDFNYILVDKNMTPMKMVMINYKSSPTYGVQIFEVSDFCKKILKEYFAEYDKKNGDFLFTMSDNVKNFEKNNFLDLIKKATMAVLGKPLGIDMIRSIQISHYYNGKAKSIAEDEASAHRFLHSSSMHKEYLKVDLNE